MTFKVKLNLKVEFYLTVDLFKLESPNLDEKCILVWLRCLLFCGLIDLDLQGQIKHESPNLSNFELVHKITCHPLELELENLDQKCILIQLRSLLILDVINLQLFFLLICTVLVSHLVRSFRKP